jgi:MYXO-CTERM domain-containing protein
MPWAERVEEYAKGGGAPVVLVDHGALIDQVLDHWNATAMCEDGGGTGGTGADTGLDDGDGPGEGGGSGTAGGASDSGSTGEPGLDDASTGGCACTAGPTGAGAGWLSWLLGVVVLGLGRRRWA